MSVPVAKTGLLQLQEVRDRAALALAPQTDDDPDVFPDLVDSVTPPALLLFWADPWLNAKTIGGMGGGHGLWDAWLEVLAVVGRADPSPSLDDLEALVAYALQRLQDADDNWPVETFYAPRRFDIGGVTYLGTRMVFRVPVTV